MTDTVFGRSHSELACQEQDGALAALHDRPVAREEETWYCFSVYISSMAVLFTGRIYDVRLINP